jgi:glutaredoxin
MIKQHNKFGAPTCCCRSGCCGEPAVVESAKREIVIDFLYLDLEVCTWCKGTNNSLDGALAQVTGVLEAGGVVVTVNRIHVDSEEKALQQRFSSSPTIRVNGRDIQMEGKESKCESCGDLCGDDVDCRIWLFQGKEYTSPPPAMIVDAILREVYGQPTTAATVSEAFVLPDNLRKFFRGKYKVST